MNLIPFYYLLFGPPPFVYVLPLAMIARIRRGRILGLISGAATDAAAVLVVGVPAAARIVPRPRSKTENKGTLSYSS